MSQPGVHVGPRYGTTGLSAASLADVVLDDCLLPPDSLLAAEGGGAAVFAWTMRYERTFILAPSVGAMRRELERSIAHAQRRHQFGAPIAAFPPVADRIARMHTRLHLARWAVIRAAADLAGRNADVRAAIAKVTTSEAVVHSALDGLENLGGYGFVSGPAERAVRDALGSRAFSGTNDMNRSLVGRLAFRW
jgi:alkylation response protein AidB-like acyl-CoA dehydrogenase